MSNSPKNTASPAPTKRPGFRNKKSLKTVTESEILDSGTESAHFLSRIARCPVEVGRNGEVQVGHNERGGHDEILRHAQDDRVDGADDIIKVTGHASPKMLKKYR